MTDRELLEKAAKAAGNNAEWLPMNTSRALTIVDEYAILPSRRYIEWNPLEDDCDAFRLAVKLQIDVQHFDHSGVVEAWKSGFDPCPVDYNGDPCAATRRAIVLAAAAIHDAKGQP